MAAVSYRLVVKRVMTEMSRLANRVVERRKDFNLIDDPIDARLKPQLSFPAIAFGG